VKAIAERGGYIAKRVGQPASNWRPVGDLRYFLEDLRARGFQPRHLVDVGANKGSWSRTFFSFFPAVAITLVEPQQELAGDLNRLCREQPRARWIQAGAGQSPGEIDFVVHPENECSSVLFTAEEAEQNGWPRRKIPIVTLDSLFEENSEWPLPDVMKIDVEGFEMEVLHGAKKTLAGAQMIFVEVAFLQLRRGQSQLHEISGFLHERGFQPYDFSFFQRRPSDGSLAVCEMIFVKRSNCLLNDQSFGWKRA
jgi:FkbM family methyltransferase